MAVSSRKVQNKRDSNGVLTGKAGTVYDVNIKYTGQDGKKKSYNKTTDGFGCCCRRKGDFQWYQDT